MVTVNLIFYNIEKDGPPPFGAQFLGWDGVKTCLFNAPKIREADARETLLRMIKVYGIVEWAYLPTLF
jgi:hypothetical protein